MKAKKLIAALLFAGLTVTGVLAQVQSGRIVGTVTDPHKAVTQNAAVIITDSAPKQNRTVNTNSTGEFTATPSNPGIYSVSVTVSGFQTTQVDNVEVVVGAVGAYRRRTQDWRTQAIMVLRSGRPFTPTISRDVSNTGLGGQRPNRIGSGKLDTPALSNWFDETAVTVPANYTYGNSGAFILREDRLKNLDFSLFKQFNLTEHSRLQFRAEAFNLTNTPGFNAPGTNIDTASGGVVLSTVSAPRNVQFALKLNF